MADRLFLERECEHGEMSEHTWFTPKKRLARSCPGGLRREITVDYEEAETWVRDLLADGGLQYDERFNVGQIAKSIVDAALGLEEE